MAGVWTKAACYAGGVADAEQASRIAAIKDLFPDYGEGFLAACLSALGQDPERVINALLEGSLPPQLSALDPAMPVQTAPAQSANGNVKAAAEGMASLGNAPLQLQQKAAHILPHATVSASFAPLWHSAWLTYIYTPLHGIM